MSTPASDYELWIAETCRKFRQATGWGLQFTPSRSGQAPLNNGAATTDSAGWNRTLHDGQDPIGAFRLERFTVAQANLSFESARDLAELAAEWMERYVAAAHVLESRSRELTTLVEMGRSLPTYENVREALGRLMQAALKLTGYRSVAFFLWNPETRELRLRAEEHLESRALPLPRRRLDESAPDMAAVSRGRALLRTDVAASASHWLPQDCATGCCFRVQSSEGLLGTFWAYDRRTRNPTEREQHVLESIAAQIVSVLERSVLRHESQAQQRLQRELKVASENQSMGIQTQPPADSRLDVAMMCTSHYEVGGDLCEIISLDDHRTLVAVGDAVGDSIPAALVMAATRGALRALTVGRRHIDTPLLMQRLNEALHSITPSHQFMSLLAGVVDTADESFTYTNAGHPVPLLLHDGELQPMHSHGMLLGVADGVEYGSSRVRLSEGDLLVLYSDGISEARNATRRMFRTDGIIDAVRTQQDNAAREVLAAVVDGLETHVRGADSADDRSVLVVRVRADEAASLAPAGNLSSPLERSVADDALQAVH